jgi:predicted aspartyl protease
MGDLPIVQATVKGQPAHFLLDTGASGIVLTEAALHRLDLQTDAKRVITGTGAGGSSRFFAGKLLDMKILGQPQPLQVPDHPVAVLPMTSGWAAAGVADGLFGVSVLSVFEVDLDLPHNEVTLYYGHLCPTTVVPPWTSRFVTLDASASAGGRFIVPVELNGRRLLALLDTGAAVTLVATDVAESMGISRAALAAQPAGQIVGTGPDHPQAYRHMFDTLTFAGQTFHNQTLMVTDRPEARVDMIIGADYLADHRVWLSYARRMVFIERPAP